MPRLIDMLNKNKMTLIAALPKNEPELALAAAAAGADALQLRLNGDAGKLAETIKASRVPVGVSLGDKRSLIADDIRAIVKMGFDFFDLKIEQISNYTSELKGATKVISLGSRFTIDVVVGIGRYGADAVDAAIIPVSEAGKDLVVGDLQNYISIIISAGIPVIIPTQRSIRTSEVAIIADTGAKGLMLTPVVTGTTVKHVEKAVREYRAAVDDLGE